MRQRSVIINTGCANISSVKFAIERLTSHVQVSDDPAIIAASDKVILPGVGSANAAMNSIQQKQLVNCIQGLTQPVLGVCLGMQLMVASSEEKAQQDAPFDTPCLNVIPGQVKRMQVGDLRLPHMGWNTVIPVNNDTIFKGIPADTYFYFVHSFAVEVSAHTLAKCDYGMPFSAAIQRDNFFGVQFHPERSGEAGATLLENFLNL
ncbi:imidazole glycerol phosphate synthase subunit HisH [Aliiglaciecola sp. LCG003]|uniref:imidazole glycerol phosphate synthase subunit HisH n=1 Tax=Aliiglaciecola sp. LCG003 TaxID=3053655 RepID=UPI002573968B|nr:imidazole glycerol phosphate synthase subunit HisH [Aliiglaciecola sp. LCG003]WJG07997.1 imidazole glycerol phosphate synthase subunit HisH [Aliiglaciecola sp. LCG003]